MKINTQAVSVFDIKIAPDQQRFACALISAPVKVYDIASGEELLSVKDCNFDSAWALDWKREPDGDFLLAGYGENGYLRILDKDGRDVLKYSTRSSDFGYPHAAQLHTDSIMGLKVIGDDLFSVSDDGYFVKFKLSRTKAGTFKYRDSDLRVINLDSSLLDLCWWADNQVLVCNDEHDIIRIDLERWEEMDTWEAHGNNIVSLAKLSEKLLLSASWDKTIKVWDAEEKKLVKEIALNNSVYTVGVFGNRIIHNDGKLILVRDAKTFEQIRVRDYHEADVRAIDCTRDGKYIVSGDDDGIVCIEPLD